MRSQRLVKDRSTLRTLVLVAILVVLVRAAVFIVDPTVGGDNFSVDGWLDTARNIVDGKGYSLTAYEEARPTAVRGPTVVFFFAALLWLFGDYVLTVVIGQWLLEAATAIVLFFIALEIFQDKRVGFVACLLFAFYVPGLIFNFLGWSEPLFTLVLAAFTLSLLRALRKPSTWRDALSGGLLGLTVLARPMMQFYPLIILPLLWWAMARPGRLVLTSFAVFCLAFAAVLSPWVIRNYLVFNAFIPGSVYSGRPFYEGNYALGQADYLRHRGAEEANMALREVLVARFGAAPDTRDLPSYARAKGIDDIELNRIASQEAVKLIQEHPKDYAVLSVVRLFRLWFHHRFVTFVLMGGKLPNAWLIAVTNGALLALALAGFIWFRGSWVRSAIPLVVLVVYSSAVYAAIYAIGRYNVPIMPYVILFAAYTMVQLFPKSNRQDRAV